MEFIDGILPETIQGIFSPLRARVAGDLAEYLHSTTGDVAAAEVSSLPSSDSDKIDKLAFGVAIADCEIKKFRSEVEAKSDRVREVKFKASGKVLDLEPRGWWRNP